VSRLDDLWLFTQPPTSAHPDRRELHREAKLRALAHARRLPPAPAPGLAAELPQLNCPRRSQEDRAATLAQHLAERDADPALAAELDGDPSLKTSHRRMRIVSAGRWLVGWGMSPSRRGSFAARCHAGAVAVISCGIVVAGCSAEETTAITVSGTAFAFELPGNPYGLIDGAEVSVLEHPELQTTTQPDGTFLLDGVPGGSEATFVIVAEGFPVAQTKTFQMPADGELPRVTFQVPSNDLYQLLADVLTIQIDPDRCQMVSTVTRVGKSLYDEGAHGEAGATVSSTPMIPASSGPVYFNDDVIPDPTFTATSTDGGVVWTNIEPGTYALSATKDGVSFESVTMKCRPGVLVNASPPYGLQAL
jgi:hypothetical protein